MQKRFITLGLFCFVALLRVSALVVKNNLLSFGMVYSKETSVRYIHIHNELSKSLNIQVKCADTSRFSTITPGWKTIAPGADDSIGIRFSPVHNLYYSSSVLILPDAPAGFHYIVGVTGQGRYRDAYYATTENKSEQELKNILKSIISKNYTSLGYNSARDKMYMVIDNQKTNGQGASVNTAECIYTGRIISGYTSRQDAQGATFNFNTEHTWPQSLFSSAEPMLSDLNHIFLTDNTANNVRGNDPFGIVSNPGWSVGGSKSVSGTFEPRDQQKGRSSRAILYFVLRYQNYSNYLNQMEQILRNWHQQFPPTKQDSLRNEAVFGLQKNRNPLIDHPEFVERITSFSDSSYAKNDSSSMLSGNDLLFSLTDIQNADSFRLYIVNRGNIDLVVGNFSNANPDLLFNPVSKILKPGEGFDLYGLIRYNANRKVYEDSVSFTFGQQVKYIRYQVKGNVGMDIPEVPHCHLYPNPANQTVTIDVNSGWVEVIDLQGNVTARKEVRNNTFDISDVPSGMYILRGAQPNRFQPAKLMIAR